MSDYEIPMGKLTIAKPDYNISFHRDGKQIGKLDFNGDEMVFVGDVDESAKVFFDYLASCFRGRLEEERAKEREACAKLCEEQDEYGCGQYAKAIRARGNT
jgi:hypothetical protein